MIANNIEESEAISNTDETVFEVEKKLRDDKGGDFRRLLTDQLLALGQEATQQLDQGITPDHLEAQKQIIAAFKAANVVLDSIWLSYHGSNDIQ